MNKKAYNVSNFVTELKRDELVYYCKTKKNNTSMSYLKFYSKTENLL